MSGHLIEVTGASAREYRVRGSRYTKKMGNIIFGGRNLWFISTGAFLSSISQYEGSLTRLFYQAISVAQQHIPWRDIHRTGSCCDGLTLLSLSSFLLHSSNVNISVFQMQVKRHTFPAGASHSRLTPTDSMLSRDGFVRPFSPRPRMKIEKRTATGWIFLKHRQRLF